MWTVIALAMTVFSLLVVDEREDDEVLSVRKREMLG